MRSTTHDHTSAHAQATIDEYAYRVRQGNTDLVQRIRMANPDLIKQFNAVDTTNRRAL